MYEGKMGLFGHTEQEDSCWTNSNCTVWNFFNRIYLPRWCRLRSYMKCNFKEDHTSVKLPFMPLGVSNYMRGSLLCYNKRIHNSKLYKTGPDITSVTLSILMVQKISKLNADFYFSVQYWKFYYGFPKCAVQCALLLQSVFHNFQFLVQYYCPIFRNMFSTAGIITALCHSKCTLRISKFLPRLPQF